MARDDRPWTKNVPVLDLSGMRNREDATRLRLKNVGLVLVPEDMPDLLAGAECKNIGGVLPVPAGTVRYHLLRARRRLRQALEPDSGREGVGDHETAPGRPPA